MKKIKIFNLKFNIEELKVPPYKIRGYIGNKFKEYVLLHHHLEKGKFLYRYPVVQYKKINNEYLIIGLEEGAEILKKIWDRIDVLKIDNQKIIINEKQLVFKQEDIGETNKPISYKFVQPWLALNQKNYEDFKLMTLKERKEKLQKILVGNILTFCKSIEYVVTEQLISKVNVQTRKAKLKKVKLIGFSGEFKINFKLPDCIGLGKSVSRGFGTIVNCDS